jgi:GAF domain-containing protein
VASTGQALNIPDAYKDPRFDPSTDRKTGYITRNILCLPVFNSANELIGVTQLINKQQGSFTASDEEFMRAFNIQAGIALENARLFENVILEKQYQKDNHEKVNEYMKQYQKKERQKSKKYDELVKVLNTDNIVRLLRDNNIDVDYFFSEI